MTQSAPVGFRTRWHSSSQARGEGVVAAKIGEAVPVVVDAVDARLVGPVQFVGKLQIVGRVGEDEIDGAGRQLRQLFEAIADQDHIALTRAQPRSAFSRPNAHHATPYTAERVAEQAEGAVRERGEAGVKIDAALKIAEIALV